jgi:hypothetical protein
MVEDQKQRKAAIWKSLIALAGMFVFAKVLRL